MLLVKIGGGKQVNLNYFCKDILSLVKKGERIVVIHGASQTRDEIAKKLGAPTKTIISPSGLESVYTDEKAIDVFLMAYAGLINKRLVGMFLENGLNAIGLSGIDGRIWEAKRKDAIYAVEDEKTKLIKDNLTGRVEKINTELIQLLVDNNYIPVICPPAISFDNKIVNTDNDFASAVMAGALGIKKIVVLFEAPGMLKDINDEKSLVGEIRKENLDSFMQYAKGRMKKKLLGAKRAFELGVEKIYWGDGRIKNPVLNALDGKGTVIV